jgi:hypothetical protein
VFDPWSVHFGRQIAERPVRALVPATAMLLAAWAVALLHTAAIRGAEPAPQRGFTASCRTGRQESSLVTVQVGTDGLQ